jgi:PAS domain S-box-containing protein
LKDARKRNRTGQPSDIEYRILSTDGQVRWIRDHAYPVMNAGGELDRVVGTARDITDRKLADLTLASTNRALQMLSRSSIAINRVEEEVQLLAEVCRVAVDVGGYRMAWVGYAQDDAERSIRPMAYAGDESGYLKTIRVSWRDDDATGQGPAGLALRTGQAQQTGDISRAKKHFFWHADALQRGYLGTICLPLRDGPHNFGVLCLYSGEAQNFGDDEIKLLQELADNLAFGVISLRARLERQRSQEAERQAVIKVREQASLLDRAQDAIMVRNLDRTIRFWNKGAERLYGWTAEEVLGKTMAELMYPDPQVLLDSMAKTLANDGDWTGELEQRARDGSPVSIEARWTVVRDEQGKVNGVLGINTNIRERKRAREEILRLNASLEERVQQRTAQLEFANKELEAFSYSVSHDLRSPLSAVDGFSDLLERTMAKAETTPLTERSRHYLARIRAGVSQMSELIDAMLTLAQVSRSSLRWERVDLSALAETLLAGYREREPGRDARLHVQPGVTGPGDPRLLKQVLDNLLGNAWKFSAKQACTDISFGREIGEAGETVYFVRDQGAGFDMAYAEKLFGAFQRLHTPSEFAGTGVGLATVQRIIARHGGKIWAKSEPGHGATFYFTLGPESL